MTLDDGLLAVGSAASARELGPSSLDTPARIRLAAAVRYLVEVLRGVPLIDDATLDDAADAVERATTALSRGQRFLVDQDPATQSGERRRSRSQLFGLSNPMAPPFQVAIDEGRVRGRGAFGAQFEGPPGIVHGGCLALAFDEALGFANVTGGYRGMTAQLTVRYRRPTPVNREVVIGTEIEAVEGRRSTIHGTMRVDGAVTAEATALFISTNESTRRR